MSEEANRKCPPRNTTVQLLTPTPTPNATIHFVTDRETVNKCEGGLAVLYALLILPESGCAEFTAYTKERETDRHTTVSCQY